jgi:hypothetical protein
MKLLIRTHSLHIYDSLYHTESDGKHFNFFLCTVLKIWERRAEAEAGVAYKNEAFVQPNAVENT